MLSREGIKWFISEEGDVYPFAAEYQAARFPNDDHVAYNSMSEAALAANL